MNLLARCGCVLMAAMCVAMTPVQRLWARDFTPENDAQVLEKLPPRVRLSKSPIASTPESAGTAARQAIELARQTADPRYLGRAQAALAPWWDRADAPVPLAILQATVQQSRHEFDAARATLKAALQRDAAQPQGWLTLATLERLAGRYAAADAACQQVAQGGALLHAAACRFETASLQGRSDEARGGLRALLGKAPDASTQAWILSLLAESEERAGRDTQAAAAYQSSLALAPDGYTAIAYADLLLRTRQGEAALKVLSNQIASDAVLLRQAHALRLGGDTRWKAQASEAAERLAALDARGDNPAWHARERAQLSLWLQDKPSEAWAAAQLNLRHQKEPLDWRLAFESAERAGDKEGLARLRGELAATGLRDARLAVWRAEGKR